jgi:hypothetical protein
MAAAVRVHFTWWGVHRTLTAQQKEEMGDAYAADARFLTAGKKIIDVRHEAFRRLTSIRSRIVSYWRALSLPYVEPGTRLIRQVDIQPFVQTVQDLRTELLQAEADLNAVYNEMKADARKRLGRLYEPADYPDELRGLFEVSWEFPSVEPPSYLMQLNPELYRQEQERVSRKFEEAVQLAEQAFVAEFSKLVSHLTERLSSTEDGDRKIFRDSAVTNLAAFFERFRTLNVRSNSQLDELVVQATRVVSGIPADDLRTSAALRQHVATQLAGVQSVLDGMLVDRPRRRLIRPTPSAQGASHEAVH